MRRRIVVFTTLAFFSVAAVGIADESGLFTVQPRTFDPAKTFLVGADWIDGIGCPTNQPVATYPATSPTGTYTDPACTTGDSKDRRNQGLLLSKEGPTANNAAAVADIKGVKGTTLTELGYDIRKPDPPAGPRGSHCGAGAPRFDITLQNGKSYFLGCNSPPPDIVTSGQAWQRLRWGAGGTLKAYNASTGTLENISGQKLQALQIVFDEGTDIAPDNFGAAILDNVDVSGTLVGRGSQGSGNGEGNGNGQGGDNGNGGDNGHHGDSHRH